MKKRIIGYVVIVQVLLILILLVKISQDKKKVLGAVSITPIKKSNIIRSPGNNLKYFYELIPGYAEQESMGDIKMEHKINGDSLNEEIDYSSEKPGGTFRIIALGDSFTFGSFVKTQENWSKLLESKLNTEMKCSNIKKFEVINFGAPGYDTQYEVERFRRRGQKYSPDLVVWYIVDPLRIDEEFWKSYKKKIQLIDRDNTINSDKRSELRNLAFLESRNQVIEKLGEKTILSSQSAEMAAFRDLFLGQTVVVPIPNMPQNQKDFLKNESSKNGYHYLDKPRNYYKMGGYFGFDRHPNALGHQIISEDIYGFLLKERLIPCN